MNFHSLKHISEHNTTGWFITTVSPDILGIIRRNSLGGSSSGSQDKPSKGVTFAGEIGRMVSFKKYMFDQQTSLKNCLTVHFVFPFPSKKTNSQPSMLYIWTTSCEVGLQRSNRCEGLPHFTSAHRSTVTAPPLLPVVFYLSKNTHQPHCEDSTFYVL